MLTQCPGCQTVFRVTSTILRAAHGQVRCGRCNTQFDAIERLLDGEESQALDPAADSTGQHRDTHTDSSDEYAAAELSHEEIVLEGTRIEISGVYRRVDEHQATVDDGTAHTQTIIEEFNIDNEAWENPFDKPDSTAADDADETELEDIEQELSAGELAEAIASLDTTALAERHANDSTDQVALATIGHLANSEATTATVNTAPLPSSDAALRERTTLRAALDLTDEPFAPPVKPPRWPWVVASIALTLLLLGQALHHSRETLSRHPSFGPQLSKLYAALGQPLTPQWQLQAYSIKQWGIVSDPQASGTLRVRASVTNGASYAQPYPLLQLSLEDRFGGKVGTREFKPEEYLGNQAQATRMLAAGEAANVDLAIVDPGVDAVGFQFDTCLLLKSGLQCSHDLTLQP